MDDSEIIQFIKTYFKQYAQHSCYEQDMVMDWDEMEVLLSEQIQQILLKMIIAGYFSQAQSKSYKIDIYEMQPELRYA